MNCEACDSPISQDRLEVLPDTKTCAGCSQEKKLVGFMIFDHKTAPYLAFINPADAEAMRLATRANRRER